MSHMGSLSGCCDDDGLTCGFDESLAVTIPLAGTRPSSAEDGVDITGWRDSAGCAASEAQLFLDGTLACTVAGLGDNGVELFAYVTINSVGRWRWIPYVHNGASIPIFGPDQGWLQQMSNLGLYERLCLVGVASAGTVTGKFVPLKRSSSS